MNKNVGFFSRNLRGRILTNPTPPDENPPVVNPGPIVNVPPNPNPTTPIPGETPGLMLYSGFNYTGQSLFITADTPRIGLAYNGYPNESYSLKYKALQPAPVNGLIPVINCMIYQGIDYTGIATLLPPGNRPDTTRDDIWNSTIRIRSVKFVYQTVTAPQDPPQYGGGDGGGGGGTKCFTGDTLILMANRTEKPISQIVPGDVVLSPVIPSFTTSEKLEQILNWWSLNLNGWRLTPQPVLKCNGYTQELCYDINEGLIKATPEHPLLIKQGSVFKFVKIKDIKIGDRIKSNVGYIAVKSITKTYKKDHYWNMAVGGSNLYFANGLVVHNKDLENLAV